MLAALLLIGAAAGGDHQLQADPRDQPLRRWCWWCRACRSSPRSRSALIEGSRFNEFAYWRSVEAKVAENLPRSAPVAEAPAQIAGADNRVETVQ